MKFKFILLLPCLFYFSCTNEPTNEYQLDKEALIKAQNDYENSTIQHQKVQSKSIITITKNEKKVLAMIEIFQNWKLDSLEKRFKPIEDEAEAKLTYFDGEYQIKPHIYKTSFNPERDKYSQAFALDINKGESWSGSFAPFEKIPYTIDNNGVALNQKYKGGMTDNIVFIFDEYENQNGILSLKKMNQFDSKTFSQWENINLQFNSIIIEIE